jgi:hypothetical protein
VEQTAHDPVPTIRDMPGEPLLLLIAPIAVVIAGFTVVTSTLAPPWGSWHPAVRIRQRQLSVAVISGTRSSRPRRTDGTVSAAMPSGPVRSWIP